MGMRCTSGGKVAEQSTSMSSSGESGIVELSIERSSGRAAPLDASSLAGHDSLAARNPVWLFEQSRAAGPSGAEQQSSCRQQQSEAAEHSTSGSEQKSEQKCIGLKRQQ